uniref:Reelin domain-containing protein n=1 Tax=Anolis carolinensis TaxID=28377 RepID=A0A803T7F1_ANOCA|nr:PREDICTED: putative defense protein 3 [Anolis carolinensis]|eukprot:XP_008121807.1 PREDICTED: putative defense protein 3 [Anolis carolinensis]
MLLLRVCEPFCFKVFSPNSWDSFWASELFPGIMSLWNLSLLFGFSVLWTRLGSHHAFTDDAPSSDCGNMLPLHPGTQPQTSPAPFQILASAPSFSKGQPISVQITGSEYRGVLLEARTFGSPVALGSWQTPPNNTRLLECFGRPDVAVTHSNTNLKTKEANYTWLPPDKDCPKVVLFVATVAQSYDVYWTDVKSKVVWKNKDATCGGMSFARAINGVMVFSLFLSLLGYN